MIASRLAPLAGVGIIVLKSSLVLAIAWCIARSLRTAPAACRHLIWLSAIVGTLLVPVVDRFLPIKLTMRPAVIDVPPVAASAADVAAVTSGESRQGQLPVGEPVESRAAEARTRWPGVMQSVGAVWGMIVLLILVRVAIGSMMVRRLARRSQIIESADWTSVLVEAASRIAVSARPRLVMSDQVETAFAFNALTPTIVLPVSAQEWPVDRRRAVLLHELAHIRRYDLMGHFIGALGCAVEWFNPFMWIAARELRIESELASDEIVLGAGVRPSEYAQHLLEIVKTLRRNAPSAAVGIARPSELEGRLVAILDPARRGAPLARRAIVAWTGSILLAAVCIGAVVPNPRTRSAAPGAQRVQLGEPKGRTSTFAEHQPRESWGRCSVFAYTTGLRAGCTSNGDVMVMTFDSNHVIVSARDTADIHLAATDLLILRLRKGTLPPGFGWYARVGRSIHTDSVLYVGSAGHQTIAFRFSPGATVRGPDAQVVDVESSLSALHSSVLTWNVLPQLSTAPRCKPRSRPVPQPHERLVLGGVALDAWTVDEPSRGCILIGDTRVEFPLT